MTTPNAQPSTTDPLAPPPRPMLTILVAVLAVCVLIGIISVPVYFIPDAVGDVFVDELINLNAAGLERRLCDDTTLMEIGRQVEASGGRLIQPFVRGIALPNTRTLQSALASAVRVESSYNVFTSEYTFRLVFDAGINNALFSVDAGVFSPDMTFSIRRNILGFTACVEA